MRTNVALLLLALASVACASSQSGQQPTAPEPAAAQAAAQPKPGMMGHGPGGGMMGHDMAATCPMAVEGTTARAEDVDGGAAMAFTTTGDVTELRRRVARMAEMHEQHHGAGQGAMMGAGHHQGMGEGMKMPPATARSEDIEGGARIVLTPKDPGDLAALREHTRQHAERMASGQCPMMARHEGASAAPGAPSEPEPSH